MQSTLIEPHVEVQVTGVQHLVGRGTEHVKVFGYRTDDARMWPIEFHLTPKDAAAIIEAAARDRKFPLLDIPKSSYAIVANAGAVKLVTMEPQ